MRINLSVIALAIFAAILFFLGAGTLSLYDLIYAQVNILPATDESTNTTSGG